MSRVPVCPDRSALALDQGLQEELRSWLQFTSEAKYLHIAEMGDVQDGGRCCR